MAAAICQCCNQNPATIHFTEIKNDEKRELHVCEACAASQGMTTGAPLTTIPTMLSHLYQGIKQPRSQTAPRCPTCGISFAEFREKGRLGCPHDYEFFEESLTPLLEKIHGSTQHRGRLPQGSLDEAGQKNDALLRLRRELQGAVKAEQYEAAARLRDQIRKVEEAPATGAAAGTSPSLAGGSPPAPPATPPTSPPREKRKRSSGSTGGSAGSAG